MISEICVDAKAEPYLEQTGIIVIFCMSCMIFLIVTVLIMPFLDIFVNCEFFLQFLHSYAKPVGMQASMEYCITVGIVTLTATILIHS